MTLDTAIVGAGLCGLALARSLHQQAQSVAVFEARPRCGGRILSATTAGGSRVDLGPAWFWPHSQPLLTRLIEELGLESIEQHDRGLALALNDPDKAAESAPSTGLHRGARRLKDSMAALIDAIVAQLPDESLYLEHVLTTVIDRDTHVELQFLQGERLLTVQARRAVLALPPRLAAEHIHFEPALDSSLRAAMESTSSWMAAQAKAVIVYAQASWREAGYSGDALVRHEQAVFSEIADACGDTVAALSGFLALPPALRRSFRVGLPMLMSSQMTQVFGALLEEREQFYQDWASEPYTASRWDEAEFGTDASRSDFSDPVLRHSAWNGRLHFGGAETAARGWGRLEGALEAARRIQREPTGVSTTLKTSNAASLIPSPATAATPVNDASLTELRRWALAQREPTFEAYRRHINRSLAANEREQLTQRAMLDAMERIFEDALSRIESLSFDLRDVPVESGRCALTPRVQAAFDGFIQGFLEDVIAFNGASCALSNFPHEHRLAKEYEQTILRDIAAVWREFSLNANALLIRKRASAAPRPQPALHAVP